MPCNDISEVIELTLDDQDQLLTLNLSKGTCGAPVGNEILMNYLLGVPVDRIVETSIEGFVPEFQSAKGLDQFLLTKQFCALQLAIEAYRGDAGATVKDTFTMESVSYDGHETEIRGRVQVDILAEKVKACANCRCKTKA